MVKIMSVHTPPIKTQAHTDDGRRVASGGLQHISHWLEYLTSGNALKLGTLYVCVLLWNVAYPYMKLGKILVSSPCISPS
jgi:hypothetical protein